MATIVLINMVCFNCGLDSIFSVGSIDKPDIATIQALAAEGQKHVRHGGYTLSLQVSKTSDIDLMKSSINKERVRKILNYKLSSGLNGAEAKEEIKVSDSKTVASAA